jgi:uncharacterized protein (DUF433 family)
MGSVEVLQRKVTTAREAARQLQIPATTLTSWLEGVERRGVQYDPVLRPTPTGDPLVTWGEMVEARYLRAYRDAGVPLQRLRPFLIIMRQKFQVPYPLAHFRPWVNHNLQLLVQLQADSDVPAELSIVLEVPSGQLLLNPRITTQYLDRVDFSDAQDSVVERIRPAGHQSEIVMDPRVASGATTIRGIRTEQLAEVAAVDGVEAAAAAYDLPVSLVQAAVAFEWADAAAA